LFRILSIVIALRTAYGRVVFGSFFHKKTRTNEHSIEI
jgi:hypothetical protein